MFLSQRKKKRFGIKGTAHSLYYDIIIIIIIMISIGFFQVAEVADRAP